MGRLNPLIRPVPGSDPCTEDWRFAPQQFPHSPDTAEAFPTARSESLRKTAAFSRHFRCLIGMPAIQRTTAGLCLVCLLAFLPAAPRAASTHVVPAGGDLQAALDAAQPGDTIVLEAGATYTGNFKLPAKNGDSYIVIRTGGRARDLPPPGTRISPDHAPALAKLRSPNEFAALSTDAGAHHWRVELLEFLANVNGAGDILTLG